MIDFRNSKPVNRFALALMTTCPGTESSLGTLPFIPSELATLHQLGFKNVHDTIHGVLPDSHESTPCGPKRFGYLKQKLKMIEQYLAGKNLFELYDGDYVTSENGETFFRCDGLPI